MLIKKRLGMVLLAALVAGTAPSAALAIGGASGAAVDYQVQGEIGEVIINP